MPLYFFNVRGGDHIDDRCGTLLADDAQAHSHGESIARELMRNREPSLRHWRMEVRSEAGDLVSETLFAKMDPTLADLDTRFRGTIEQLSSSLAGLNEAIREAKATVRQSRALMARAAGKPYLAAIAGRRVDDRQ